MKKQNLFLRTAWAAGVLAMAGSAHAGVIQGTGTSGFFAALPQASATQMAKTNAAQVVLSENGPGHILVIPYFSTQAGQVTTFRLVNTDTFNGKAVKLNIRGAANGDQLLNFQVLLGPGDSWVGTLAQAGNGTSVLTVNDKSCTYPALPATGVQLFPYRLNPRLTAAEAANHTREGLIEAIVAADIPGSSVYGSARNAQSPLFKAIQSVNGAAPACTLSTLDAALLNNLTTEADAARVGLSTPSGGIMANWSIADIVKGATYSGNATAFAAVTATGARAQANFVLFPQTADAVLNGIEAWTSDPLLIPGPSGSPPPVMTAFYDLPDLSTPYILPASEGNSRRTRARLSELLSARQLNNQFMVDAASGRTDWVVTMPTKRYYLGYDYSKTGAAAVVRPRPVQGHTDYDYFMTYFSAQPNCIDRGFGAYRDRDGREGLAAGVSQQERPTFCGAASVLSFNGPNNASALSASVSVQKPSLPASIGSGWVNIPTSHMVSGLGLPMVGAAFVRQGNSGPPSAAAGLTWPHNFER